MKNKLAFKILLVFLLMFSVAFIWGAVFIDRFLPKEMTTMKKNVFGSQTVTNINSSHSIEPILSNQWYTPLTQAFPSHPMYAMPLAFQTTPRGLGFSYPEVRRTSNTIFAPYDEDFTIGIADNFKQAHLNSVGDWTINASLVTADNKTMTFTIGHGLPSATLRAENIPLQMSARETFKVYADNKEVTTSSVQTDAFMISIRNKYYIVALPQKTTITIKRNALTIDPVENVFVGLLDKPENFALFKESSKVVITDSHASPQIAENKLNVLYKLSTQNGAPLIALYPHQFDLLPAKHEIVGKYQTLRGELRLVKTDNFTLSFPHITPDGTFTRLHNDYPDLTEQIKRDIQAIISGPVPESKNYFLGTWFGKVSNLLLLADVYELEKEKQDLLQFVKPIFLKSLDEYEYNQEMTSLIAKNPEFGNEELNDHHFHYGYYIRTAAVISSIDLPFLSEVKDKVNEMVNDIANLERSSQDYPYVRNFDIYEGHSWADGKGDTPDGNNQESSSEAVHSWYSLFLWGKVTNDANLQKNALYLYNMESQAASYYWFNKNNIYGSPYNHAIASMVWGGKIDFATWFSSETNMKYGIQLLPITPASVYLGNLPDFMKYERDFRTSGGSETKEWGDLFIIWKSFYYPKETVKMKNAVAKPENNTSRSIFLYMLYYNSEQQAEEDLQTQTSN